MAFSGQKTLIAYVVLTPSSPIRRASLTLTSRTPLVRKDLLNTWTHQMHGYLVPQEVVIIEDELPRDDEGNVDEALLPSPALTSHASFAPPSNPLQAAVAEVRRDVLQELA